MLKKSFALFAVCLMLASAVPCLAVDQPIAPEYVKGKITAVVVAEEGAFVYDDFDERKAPVSALPYGAEIEIRSLGLGWCSFTLEGFKGSLYIRTNTLSFSESPYGNQIAIVFLQRSKSLPMHKTASTKSKNVTKVPDGQYVVIVERGDDFSLARWGRYEGYLQNDCLSFRDVWEGPVEKSVLRDPNNPDRRTTVNIRSADRSNGTRLKQFPTLRPLTVLQVKDNGWAEVETEDGLHGYLRNTNKGMEWLDLDMDIAFTPVERTETPTEMLARLADEEAARLAEEQRLAEEEAARLAEEQRLAEEEAAEPGEEEPGQDETPEEEAAEEETPGAE